MSSKGGNIFSDQRQAQSCKIEMFLSYEYQKPINVGWRLLTTHPKTLSRLHCVSYNSFENKGISLFFKSLEMKGAQNSPCQRDTTIHVFYYEVL